MTTGENSTTWGNVTNVNLGTALEEAIVGSADVTFSSADVTLSLTDSNSSQTARNLRLNLIGTTGGARSLVVPAIEKAYVINNGCADAITVKNASGTGIAVPAGKTMWVYNDATNVVNVATHLTSLTLAAALPVASGGTGVTASTGSGNNVLSASPTLTGTVTAGTVTASGDVTLATGRMTSFQMTVNSGSATAASTVQNFIGVTNSDQTNNIEFGQGRFDKTNAFFINSGASIINAVTHCDFRYGANVQAGYITSTGLTTTYASASDERLKDWESVPQTDYSTAIKALWVGDYTWKAHGERGFGVRAQQAYATLGGLGVSKPDTEEGTWGASAEPFGHLALWGVKDLYALVEKLSARVAELEARV
jgi:hypothetical protein